MIARRKLCEVSDMVEIRRTSLSLFLGSALLGPTAHVNVCASQAACVDATTASAQKCGGTVAQIEACWQSTATLVKECNINNAANTPECQTLAAVTDCEGIANGGGTAGYGTP
jgi:hypothetical protein